MRWQNWSALSNTRGTGASARGVGCRNGRSARSLSAPAPG